VDTEEIAKHMDRSNHINNKVKVGASEAQASGHFANMLAEGELS
jgi:hypothetical protein